ncbi:ParB N-terminal domain-containing protein [Devosia sp. 66-14]|uniref:ParB/RepB/Spo0J family partition protein n=1 Tax=unclassified Devosia TaxID=196773 RepID=UPI003450C3B5
MRVAGDGWEVIAGVHRLEACKSLGLVEIPADVVGDDDLHAELAMIDENLCRAELTPSDRARQTARRAEIYRELHPETVKGGNQGPDGQFAKTIRLVPRSGVAAPVDLRSAPVPLLTCLQGGWRAHSAVVCDGTCPCADASKFRTSRFCSKRTVVCHAPR